MFITLEGPEGSGKTSQLTFLANEIKAAGFDLLLTHEPGGTPVGDQIRDVIMDLKNKSMRSSTELLLFLASRAQLVGEVIRPALEAGKVVVCDRYADSTLAYQGYGHGHDLEKLRQVVEFATDGLQPDLTVFFDLSVEQGLERRTKDGGWNRLDDYDLEFHQRVYQGYQALMKAEPQRWQRVDASLSPLEVAEQVKHIVLNFLKKHERKIAES
jgi:dTMP kinase